MGSTIIPTMSSDICCKTDSTFSRHFSTTERLSAWESRESKDGKGSFRLPVEPSPTKSFVATGSTVWVTPSA